MQHVQVGGEALTQAALDAVAPSAATYNYYGPTEAAIWATRREMERAFAQLLPSIGRPLHNVSCHIIEAAAEQPQPVGVWGELWLGGVQVARGYLHRPDITAERFVPHPWPHLEARGRAVTRRRR